MSFLKELVARDDQIVKATGLHWIYLVTASVWPLVLLLAAFAIQTYILPYHDILPRAWWEMDVLFFHFDYRNPPVVFFGILLSAAVAMPSLVKFFTTRIVLTESHVIYKTGLISIDVQEVDLEEIKGEKIHKNFIGHILDFGDLHLDCRLIGDFTIRTLKDPEGLFTAINRQRIRKVKEKGGHAPELLA